MIKEVKLVSATDHSFEYVFIFCNDHQEERKKILQAPHICFKQVCPKCLATVFVTTPSCIFVEPIHHIPILSAGFASHRVDS